MYVPWYRNRHVRLAKDIIIIVILWQALKYAMNTRAPVVVVLENGMQPSVCRGDLLLVQNRTAYHVGDVVVFDIDGHTGPFVRRIVEMHPTDNTRFLTKGDTHGNDDRDIYAPDQEWLSIGDVRGFAHTRIPWVGWLVIWSQSSIVISSIVCSLVLSADIAWDDNAYKIRSWLAVAAFVMINAGVYVLNKM